MVSVAAVVEESDLGVGALETAVRESELDGVDDQLAVDVEATGEATDPGDG